MIAISSPKVIVIDYGVGNLLSIRRGLEHCGAVVTITSDPEQILAASRVVLPGVGAFGTAMDTLKNLEIVSVIHEVAKRGTPFLSICLGMQLLLNESEEFGVSEGFGLISGKVTAIPDKSINGEPIKIPHIGWNSLISSSENVYWDQTLLADNQPGDAMYFVHSFMANPSERSCILANSIYEGHRIPAVIVKENITGCQFHPEKSGELGLKILSRFLKQ